MVYVDEMAPTLPGRRWRFAEACHLVADSEPELMAFARRLRCHPSWVQRSRAGLVHFDLTRPMRERAVRLGAEQVGRCKIRELLNAARTTKENEHGSETSL